MNLPAEQNIWNNQIEPTIPSNIMEPTEIVNYAVQLSVREKQQICGAYASGAYELVAPFIWAKSISSLKRELAKLGVVFVAEMLGKQNISPDTDINDIINERESITLAEELGMISKTDAMRWRNNMDIVNHFTQRQSEQDSQPMQPYEAIGLLHTSVSSILSKPSIDVAIPFVNFRENLESKLMKNGDADCNNLLTSPYFFRRLSLMIMLSGIRTKIGAQLEYLLANLNTLLPLLWPELLDTEKWSVGNTYYELYGNGIQMSVQTEGLKKALLKVRGFDYVKETLRSQTFTKTANAIINAHEGMNNFYTESEPVLELEKLGTVIPAPALGKCISALLCVSIGNIYGHSYYAAPISDRILNSLPADRWVYYFNNILPGDIRILGKLGENKPLKRWMTIKQKFITPGMDLKQNVKEIAESASEERIKSTAANCLNAYYKATKK